MAGEAATIAPATRPWTAAAQPAFAAAGRPIAAGRASGVVGQPGSRGLVGHGLRSAQIDPLLPSALAKHHAEVGAKTPIAARPPRGDHAALRGHKCRVGRHLRLHPLQPGRCQLSNGLRFLHVWFRRGERVQGSAGQGSGLEFGRPLAGVHGNRPGDGNSPRRRSPAVYLYLCTLSPIHPAGKPVSSPRNGPPGRAR